jgi:hypothetical protein
MLHKPFPDQVLRHKILPNSFWRPKLSDNSA